MLRLIGRATEDVDAGWGNRSGTRLQPDAGLLRRERRDERRKHGDGGKERDYRQPNHGRPLMQ